MRLQYWRKALLLLPIIYRCKTTYFMVSGGIGGMDSVSSQT